MKSRFFLLIPVAMKVVRGRFHLVPVPFLSFPRRDLFRSVAITFEFAQEDGVAPTGLNHCGAIYPGRGSRARFALGYYLSGFQPFQFEARYLGIDESLASFEIKKECSPRNQPALAATSVDGGRPRSVHG
jgi:hypothetical protein